jgi:DNA-binding NtrC family response regulator
MQQWRKIMSQIMIVDDDQSVREIISASLKNEHEVVEAADLAQARELLVESKPQVMLIDNRLSDGKGDELVKNNEVGDASCVLITAFNVLPDARADLLNMGFLYVVQKPFDLKELVAIVNRSYQHWQMKMELKQCMTRGFRPESVKKLHSAASVFRNALVSARAFCV